MMPTAERFRPERADWAQAALVAVALFIVFATTAIRTVGSEDDGLFILSSYFLGIEHPPGYPLFTLIGHLFSLLPFGSVAYRVHLASAVFGALTGAAAWLCARLLCPGRLPAYLTALGLGLSPVFWSQAVIAEVYTLNTFFFLVLVYLGLQACPPDASVDATDSQKRLLPWMALLFGLSLSNHYPLMFLVAPGFLILLWPLRSDLLKRLPLFLLLIVLGLLPYAWLVYRSWQALPISFYGSLETLPEIWFFLSRSGYVGIDHSTSAGWLDKISFLEFMTSQLFVQFAVVGTFLAAAGFAVQWRVLGRRVSAFLTAAFLGPSVVLILLLGFDYGALAKHVFHVYPLPAYAVAALWMGLGLTWIAERFTLRLVPTAALGAIVLAAIFVLGVRENALDDDEWMARYAQAVLRVLPKDAIVFVAGDPDLATIAYFHMIEGRRPDITLYSPKGLVLGNRLFNPMTTGEEDQKRVRKKMIEQQSGPVVATLHATPLGATIDRWLYSERDPGSGDPNKVTVDIPEEAVLYFEKEVAMASTPNAWVAFVQNDLRRWYAVALARSLSKDAPVDERKQRDLDVLGRNFYGALGIVEGLMLNKGGYSPGVVLRYLDTARDLMPSDVVKPYLSRYFQMRGQFRADQGDPGARADLETAVDIWPSATNSAVQGLENYYADKGETAALNALKERAKTFKRPGVF
jgi:hypothetical protein